MGCIIRNTLNLCRSGEIIHVVGLGGGSCCFCFWLSVSCYLFARSRCYFGLYCLVGHCNLQHYTGTMIGRTVFILASLCCGRVVSLFLWAVLIGAVVVACVVYVLVLLDIVDVVVIFTIAWNAANVLLHACVLVIGFDFCVVGP